MPNILLVGNSGCGKTTYINILNGLNFSPLFNPSDQLVITHLDNNRTIYECGGQEHHYFNEVNIMNEIDKIIIMIDITNNIDLKNIRSYIHKYMIYNKPIYLCINKSDVKLSKPKTVAMNEYIAESYQEYNIPIIRMSCRTGENIDFINFLE